MRKIFITIVGVLLFATISHAQQLTTSSFYELQGILHNPATAGSQSQTTVGISYRSLWSQMPGSPKTALLFGSSYLPKAKIGLGGYLYKDVTGPISYTGLQMAYAYRIPISENRSFSLGLEGRFLQFSFDRNKLQEALGPNDPVIWGDASRVKGDAGVGLAYSAPTLELGASASQLIQSRLHLFDKTGLAAKLYRHYYLHGNYKWNVDGYTKVVPNFLFIYLPNAPVEFTGGARVIHKELFWWGLTWHSKQAWMFSAGYTLKEKLNLGYSFDIYRTPLSAYFGGSYGHELLLRYSFQ